MDGYEVIWLAQNGSDTLRKCNDQPPDVVILDILLPPLNGIETTRQIMAQRPCAILILTGTLVINAPEVLRALNCGALDVARTSLLNPGDAPPATDRLPPHLPAEITDLCRKLQLVHQRFRHRSESTRITAQASPTPVSRPRQDGLPALRQEAPRPPSWSVTVPPLLVIGSSTGGPKALGQILAEFPADLPIAIAIIQHVDRQFAASLALWLDEQTQLKVRLAEEGDRLQAGQVLIAGTNDHLICQPNLELAYTCDPADYAYRPSVDVFFHSLAQNWPTTGLAALLTGMGRDGAIGLAELRKRGWKTIAQDQASSAVYGMPKAAAELKAAMQILPIEAIGPACLRHFERG